MGSFNCFATLDFPAFHKERFWFCKTPLCRNSFIKTTLFIIERRNQWGRTKPDWMRQNIDFLWKSEPTVLPQANPKTKPIQNRITHTKWKVWFNYEYGKEDTYLYLTVILWLHFFLMAGNSWRRQLKWWQTVGKQKGAFGLSSSWHSLPSQRQ